MKFSLKLKSIHCSYLFIPSITSFFSSFYTSGHQYLGLFERLSIIFNGCDIKYSFENTSVVIGYGVHNFLPGLSYSALCFIELYTICSK